MGTTPGGLPYPEPTDPINAGADAIKALALAMDAHLWEPTWTTPTFASGWSTATAGMRRTRDGVWLIMRGTVDRDGAQVAAGGNSTVMTLPAGWRPAKWYRIVVATGGNPWTARLQIDPAGGVILSTPTVINTGGYFHLDGVLFTTVN